MMAVGMNLRWSKKMVAWKGQLKETPPKVVGHVYIFAAEKVFDGVQKPILFVPELKLGELH